MGRSNKNASRLFIFYTDTDCGDQTMESLMLEMDQSSFSFTQTVWAWLVHCSLSESVGKQRNHPNQVAQFVGV